MKKKIFRLVSFIIACFLGIICLAGCDGGPSQQGDEDNKEETGTVKPERDIEAVSPADNGTAVLANAVVAEFSEEYKVFDSENYVDATSSVKKDLYAPTGVMLEWSCKQEAEEYTVSVSFSQDMTDAAEYTAEDTTLKLNDLFVATDYFWQVEAQTAEGAIQSDVFRFTTAQTPRTIFVEGVSNTRDIGGYTAADGKRVKQGIVYRGGKLDDITSGGKAQLLNGYGIRTDLDLRGDDGKNILAEDVNYIHISSPSYTTPHDSSGSGIDVAANHEALASIIKVFAVEENYPIYMHCAIGRDRTGTVAMLLELLLGMSENDIYMDYELSLFSAAGCSDNTPFDKLFYTYFWPTYNYISQNYSGGSMMQKCESFMLEIGLMSEEISSIRALLLV